MAVGAAQSSYLSTRFTRSDSKWPEVRYINNHAVFMEYLSRVVAGLGILIFTWSTVVLLGGFVTTLDKKDFWFLTVITLCQTKEASSAIAGGSIWSFYGIGRFLSTAFSIAEPPDGCDRLARWASFVITHVIVPLFRILVFTSIVFPLVVVYSFGICFSTTISLYRLTRRDLRLGSGDGDAAASTNLQKAALHVLYVLALVQGVLHFYRKTFISTGRKMVRKVAKEYDYDLEDFLIGRYALETRNGCMKDLSFVRGRNLVTYAVSLIESAPLGSGKLLDGVRIMDTLIRQQNSAYYSADVDINGQRGLMRQLMIGSAFSTHILGKLIETISMPSRAEHDSNSSTELRGHAASIVAYFAGDIRLNMLPGGIECISSMLQLSTDTRSKHRFLQGMHILRKLAHHDDNCKVISNAEGLASRIMAPLSFDLLHRSDHEEYWSDVVEASMNLVARLVVAPGVTGVKLRREISSNMEAMVAMESVVACGECRPVLRELAIKILVRLAMDASSNMSPKSREKLLKSLVCIFTDGNMDSSIRKSARQALAMLSAKNKSYAVFILQANGNVVGVLTNMLLHSEENQSRVNAAEILSHLCNHYTKDDEYLAALKKAIKDVMPEVLRQVLQSGAPGGHVQKGPEANNARFSPSGTIDIENQDDGYNLNTYISSHQQNSEQHMGIELLASFLSLTATVFEVSQGQDLVQLIDAVAPRDDGFTFAGKLMDMVQRNIVVDGDHETMANCLRIMKSTTKMIISMVRHSCSSFAKEEDEDLESLIYYLHGHSTGMNKLEGVMSLADSDHGAKQPFKTLASLVKEARELWDKKKEQAKLRR